MTQRVRGYSAEDAGSAPMPRLDADSSIAASFERVVRANPEALALVSPAAARRMQARPTLRPDRRRLPGTDKKKVILSVRYGNPVEMHCGVCKVFRMALAKMNLAD
jgi:hypothetical protein